jgi:hypothetical protein
VGLVVLGVEHVTLVAREPVLDLPIHEELLLDPQGPGHEELSRNPLGTTPRYVSRMRSNLRSGLS